jgi:hypothetical protein
MRVKLSRRLVGVCTLISLVMIVQAARAQNFRYEPEPRAGQPAFSYADADPAPRMMGTVPAARPLPPQVDRSYRTTASTRPQVTSRFRSQPSAVARVTPNRQFLRPTSAVEPIPPGQPVDPFAEELPPGDYMSGGPVQSEMYYDGAVPADVPLEPQVMDGEFLTEPGPEYFANAVGCCGGGYCLLRHWWRNIHCLARNGAYTENMSFFTGKQGFKGPVDQGVNGDFGYHGGGNWGMPLLDAHGIGYQIGANYIASDFAGRTGPLGHRRAQFFVTSGVFKRVSCERGFQGGAVVDYLRDDFYIQMDLTQVRGELSYVCHGHEFGFWGAFTGNTSTHLGEIPGGPMTEYSFEATSQYNLFYRYESCNGTFCRTWGGLSGHGDGIFGGDATVRISKKIGLMANYNYLLPRNDDGVPNNVKESWNLTISFIWYPGYTRPDSWRNPYRPLFYTADNGWFFTRQEN